MLILLRAPSFTGIMKMIAGGSIPVKPVIGYHALRFYHLMPKQVKPKKMQCTANDIDPTFFFVGMTSVTEESLRTRYRRFGGLTSKLEKQMITT